jgi:hypothetical protein
MITTLEMPRRRSGALRVFAGSLFAAALLGFTSCGGGGHGHGSNAVSAVQVQTVQPGTGPFIGGTPITLHGRNFKMGEVNTVEVGGHPATDVVIVDETTLTATTPAGTPGATVDVTVTNSLGQGRLAGGFTYLMPVMPRSDVNGDGIADLVVAAPLDDSAGVDAGAVYVFFGSDDPVALLNRTADQADLKIVGHHAGDGFGSCVCAADVDGDHIPDLLVGASLVDAVNAPDAGAVYVFRGPLHAGPTMSALAANVRLTGQSTIAGDRFGSSVQVADVTGDGIADVLVAATQHDGAAGIDTGCVYCFRGGATLVSKGAEAADMAFDGEEAGDRLGNAVTCGDIDGDGSADLVLAAQLANPWAPTLMQHAGKVYVVRGGASMVSGAVSSSDIVIHGSAVEDRFGTSAVVADVNGDGIDDVLVGAPLNDSFDVDTGRVYVFFGGAGIASGSADDANVMLSGLPTHNSFGRTIRTGDVDGDSIADILVGAPDADYLNDSNGRVYMFRGGPTLQSHVAVEAAAIFNGEQVQDEALGSSLSLLDLNGDGFADICCSSAAHAASSGRVYMWLGSNTLSGQHLAATSDILYSGVEAGSRFGEQVAPGQ